MVYKTLKKVSNVCQLLDKSKYHASTTINGVTFTNNGDGSITLNGTATELCQYKITNSYKKLIGENTNKCLLIGSISANSGTPYFLQLDFLEGNSWSRAALDFGKGVIFTNSDSSTQLLSIIVKSGVTVNNLTFKPQIFDLTEMYGAGHEPTTVEQFRQDFPEEMYDYSPHCFVTSYKTLLKASDVCQLLDKSKFAETGTLNGVTFHNNGDGSYTLNGTSTDYIYFNFYKLDKKLRAGVVPGVISSAGYYGEDCWYDINNHLVFYLIGTGQTFNNQIIRPQIFDLTEMFGAGKEPTTVEEFRQKFPNELYDYKPYSTIPSYKKSLVCKTKNLFDYSKVNGLINSYSGASLNKFLIINGTSFRNSYSLYAQGTHIIPSFILKAGTYTISLLAKGTAPGNAGVFGIVKFNSDGTKTNFHGNWTSSDSRQSYTFTLYEDSEVAIIIQGYGNASNYLHLDSTFTDIQLELSDTATNYVPYGYL